MSDDHAKHYAEGAVGALTELARRGGQNLGPHHAHGAAKAGELLVKGAAVVAPGAVAAASLGTAAVISATAATAVALAPVAVVAAGGYAVYKLVGWIRDL